MQYLPSVIQSTLKRSNSATHTHETNSKDKLSKTATRHIASKRTTCYKNSTWKPRAWNKSTYNKEKITSRHHMHMTHGLVVTNKTSLNVETVSASVKQQHHHSMFASLKQRSYEVKISKNFMPKKYLQNSSNHVIGASPKEAQIN